MSEPTTDQPADRLPPIPPDQWTAAQTGAVAHLINGPRGAVDGPFIALLRSPDLLVRLSRVGEYLRDVTTLDQRVVRTAVLVTARHYRQPVEWRTNVRHALAAGVSVDGIDDIEHDRASPRLRPDEALAHAVAVDLLQTGQLTDDRYDAAAAVFGEAGVIDLVSVVGYFTLLALVLNVARTP